MRNGEFEGAGCFLGVGEAGGGVVVGHCGEFRGVLVQALVATRQIAKEWLIRMCLDGVSARDVGVVLGGEVMMVIVMEVRLAVTAPHASLRCRVCLEQPAVLLLAGTLASILFSGNQDGYSIDLDCFFAVYKRNTVACSIKYEQAPRTAI